MYVWAVLCNSGNEANILLHVLPAKAAERIEQKLSGAIRRRPRNSFIKMKIIFVQSRECHGGDFSVFRLQNNDNDPIEIGSTVLLVQVYIHVDGLLRHAH